MEAAIALVLLLLALQHGPKCDHQLDVATAQRMQQREEYLHQKMTHLLQEIEQIERADKAPLLSLWQQWPVWTLAAALLLLAAVCLLARARKRASTRCSEQNSPSHEEKDEEEEKDLSAAQHRAGSLAVSTPTPTRESERGPSLQTGID